jgi:hypothetical protein
MKKAITGAIFLIISFASCAQVEYKDVASIFYARCFSCHNPESHGPSYLNYASTKPWVNQIQGALISNKMPPWPPDTNYSRFVHENKILPAEKQAILNWINGGAMKGDTTAAPSAPPYSKYKLKGQPDLELRIPAFTSNASGDDSYVCFSIPMGLSQTRTLRAYEIIAGDPKIVHHVVVNIDSNATTSSDLSGNCFNITGDYSIGAFAPGTPPTVFPGKAPLKSGIRIKAGSKLVMQVHYPAGTVGKPDSTKIRLYFYPFSESGVRAVNVSTPLQNWGISIPAGSTRTFTAIYPSSSGIPQAMSILSTFPHSHKAATELLNCAILAGDTIPLIKINEWEFDQQGYYTFQKMPKVPAGYKLYSRHVYYNGGTSPIFAGTNTTDEMLFDSFQWFYYQAGDELIDIKGLLESDTLLTGPTGTGSNGSSGFIIKVYPNPFENDIRFQMTLDKPGKVQLKVFDIFGRVVRLVDKELLSAGFHDLTSDLQSNGLTPGSYFYSISMGNRSHTGKLVKIGD